MFVIPLVFIYQVHRAIRYVAMIDGATTFVLLHSKSNTDFRKKDQPA